MKIYHVRLSQNHMATTFTFVISEAVRIGAAEFVLAEAHKLVEKLEANLSEFRSDSPVYRLNHARPGEPIIFPPETWKCFQRSLFWEEKTEGAFSPAAKSTELSDSVFPFGWDEESQSVWRRHSGAHLGFGAIGKGFGLDEVRVLIEQAGFSDYLLNAGGSSLILSGFAQEKEPWRWGWSWKKNTNGEPLGLPLAHWNGQTIAIGVSGIDEKGQHLIDPKTRKPVSHRLSALAALNSATDADALSTALFVSGWEKCHQMLAGSLVESGLAFVEKDQCPKWNGLFAKLWGHPAATTLTSVLLFLFSDHTFADEAVDLKDFGVDDFTPYLFERNSLWILLPAIALLIVFAHLQNNNPKRPSKTEQSEEKTP